jgi:hypothetical protein
MNRYEYMTIKTDILRLEDADLLARLNDLGAQGWNLVTAIPQEKHGYSHAVHLLFSRETAGALRSELCAPA